MAISTCPSHILQIGALQAANDARKTAQLFAANVTSLPSICARIMHDISLYHTLDHVPKENPLDIAIKRTGAKEEILSTETSYILRSTY